MAPECPGRLSPGTSTFLFIAAAGITTVAIFLLIIYSGPPWLTTRPRGAFCCPGLLELLWDASNLTIDPCRDFYHYTCYNWDRTELVSRNSKAMLRQVYIPTYGQSRSKSLASRTISRYYRDCLDVVSDRNYGLAAAVWALLDVLRPPASPTPTQMFQLLSRVTIAYGMSPGITVKRVGEFHVEYLLPVGNADGWVTEDKVPHRIRGLLVFNEMTSSNVSWNDVQELAASGFLEGVPADVTRSHSSVLADILPEIVGLEDWNRTWERYTGFQLTPVVRHSNVSRLRVYFRAMVRGPQPAALALLVVEASVRSWEPLQTASGGVTVEKGQKACHEEANGLLLLWDVVAMETFTDPHKDRVVRAMYTTLFNQVLTDFASLFPPGDVGVMRRRMLQMKLILASDMHLRDIEPPVNVSGYWRRNLAVKDYTTIVRKHQSRLGVPYYTNGMFSTPVAQCTSTAPANVMVSPALYVALNFTPGSEASLNMAVAGPDMACFWRMILRNLSDYSARTASVIRNFTRCARSENVVAYRKLAVETAASASREANWREPIFAWGSVPVTRSRIFYMSHVLNNVCGSREGVVGGTSYTNSLMQSMPDFREAFGCAPSPGARSAYCHLNSSL